MKRRFTILTAALALLVSLAIPMGMRGQTKTEGFETATASTTYNSTVNLTTQQSDCGIAWTIYYGCVSTNNKISGNKSAQMRWYSSATSNHPYLQSTTAIDGLTNVAFKAKVGNTNVKMDVHYSSDGNNWIALATAETFSSTSAADFSYTIPSGGKYIKIGVSPSSTAPSSGNYAFIVDNVVFTYSSSVNTYTVTYHANVTGTTDIEVEYNEGDDVTVAANTFTNPGYAFTEWNTSADGTGTSYDPEDVIEDINNDIDLYAQWEESTSTTGTINFGNSTGYVAITDTEVTGDDNFGNEWTITTVGTTYFYAGYSYNQIGSSSKPATSITFTTTLPDEVNVTAMEAKFGGFTGTAGDITMKVGNTTIGSGSLDAGNDVTVNSSSTEIGNELTVTITSISKGVKAYYISYTYEAATPDPAVATTTTINVPSDFNNDIYTSTTAGTLSASVTETVSGNAVSGATVTWSSSDTGVATIGSDGVVTLVAVGTTTITASYAGVEDQYRPSTGTYELTVTDSNAPGTQNNPYTVAQAIANTPSSGNVYIQGIVSSFYNTSIVGDGSNYRYYISDDGTTTTQLLVYKGKGLNQATFANADDLLVGDEVVIYGTLITYQNAPEVASGNYLYSWNRPVAAVEAPTFSPAAGTFTTAQTVTLSCATTGATIYYTLDGTEPTNASTEYTSALTISNTTTVKAIAYVGTDASTVATATYHFCSAEDPYTVTEALAFNEYPANGIYVHGIVSTAPTQNPTSNGELTYYISVDGEAANQLEVYKGKGLNQAAFDSQNDIQVGDIVTIYGNVVIYNGTKEFSSGNYLVSFERPAQQYTLTVTCSENVEIFTFVGESTDPGVEGSTTLQVTNGTEVGLSVSVSEGYVLTLMVDGENVTSDLDDTGYYTFSMPAHAVTVTATASVAPVVTTNTYTLATSIESGKQYIIVGWANGTPYAMGYDKGNNRHAVEISVTGDDNETASATIANTQTNPHEFTITSLGNGYYSIMDATTLGGYLYAAASGSNHLKTETTLDENHNGEWKITITDGSFSVVADQSSNRNVMQFNNSSNLFACYASASQHPVYLYVKDETPVTETFTKHITGYTNNGGYYLIASPIGTVAPTEVTNMITDDDDNNNRTYDLYRFQQDPLDGMEWRNYRAPNEGFDLNIGQGYLYAHRTDVDLVFTGSAISETSYEVPLTKVAASVGLEFPDWNLVGNPFADVAHIDGGHPFYTLDVHGAYTLVSDASTTIESMQGVFVVAGEDEEGEDEESITFVKGQPSKKSPKVTLNVSKGTEAGVIDRAIVCFGETRQMPKFQLFKNSTKVYIPMEGKDYALVRGEEMGAMPVNFKAEENGTYSMNFTCEYVGFAYLHLIDNKTGNDVDLLKTPSYSFEAKTTDYESRFKLVFATGDNSNDDTFAFYSNGSFVINNEGNAELQVIDITGRIVKSESVNGCTNVNVNAAPGVYMLRLVNGDNVKVQKVVVK